MLPQLLPLSVTPVTPVGFVDAVTIFQGAETIKCGHGVYKVTWTLQSYSPIVADTDDIDHASHFR
jgi:hypothetical protein